MITDEQIITEARSWIGTPFKHQGRKKGAGIDCVGLIYCVANKLGIAPPEDSLPQEYRGYAWVQDGDILREAFNAYMDRISINQAGPADVFVMVSNTPHPQHAAIYTGKTIIHAFTSLGRCQEHSLSDKWRRRIRGAYRFRRSWN